MSNPSDAPAQADSDVALRRYHELLDGLSTTDGLQLPSSGYGKLIHRQYSLEFQCNDTASEVIEAISRDPNRYCNEAMASFEKVNGASDSMEVGDEYLIRISGPWNGPVRVIDLDETSFALATRDGHLEAGFIEFKAADLNEHQCRLTIQSWATSGGPLVWATYSMLRVTKLAQTAMWTEFCTLVAERIGDGSEHDVQVSDSSFSLPKAVSNESDEQSTSQLADLQERGFNYEVESYSPDDPSWRHDSYVTTVGTESPGPPDDGGLFLTAKRIVSEYRFPDPRRVKGKFDQAAPLDGRNMLLDAQFLGIRVQFAVRVVEVIDRQVQRDEATCQEWGYAYRTLDGHWEVGQMTFLVRKNCETGEVLFLINAYSRTGRIPNPFYRFGFWLVGRKVQTNFAKRCLRRLVKLTNDEIDQPRS
ncbi:DUF1990 family protein [Neorhodopirellula lusitana]|uniref:DUF1990 family protein n=1 Tax=Neorhodopirellula lusitana TaxID=445327 RepID=UPI00384F33E7